MKNITYSDSQIMATLNQAVAELCREHDIGNSTFYKWRAKYGGMEYPIIPPRG
jgi:putative transposase